MPISISILTLGFFLGLRHATDADHVVAITTVSRKESIKGSALIGILWGIGHSITVTLVGIPIIFFALKIPPKILLTLEFSVGVMLVILGLANLYSFCRQIEKTLTTIFHKHTHSHFNIKDHSHLHIHLKSKINNKIHHLSLRQMTKPIFIGLMHGLAGSAAVAVLILATINNNLLAIFYLAIFHIGVIIGMMIITTILGAFIKMANQKIAFIHEYLVAGSGILSIVFGLYISYQIGFVDGLFK